jgi:PAS domain-containing protein
LQYQVLDDFARSIHPNDLKKFHQNSAISSQTSLKTGEGFSYECRIIRPDGQVRYVKETEHVTVNPSREIISSFGTLQDITEFKLTVKALQQSEESYSSLFFNLPLGTQEEDCSSVKKALDKLHKKGIVNIKTYLQRNPKFLVNLVKGIRCKKVNLALLNMHGADSEQEFNEEDVDKWWNDGWVDYFSNEISAFAANSSAYHETERVDTRIDNSRIEIRSITSVVPGYEENWERVFSIHEDITDRKKMRRI